MRLVKQTFASVVAAAAITAVAGAQPGLNSTGSQWSAATPNNSSGAYWDNSSDDGANCNAGFFVVGTFGTCSNQHPNNISTYSPVWSDAEYLHATGAPGTGVTSFFGAGTYNIFYFGNVAGANPVRQFGIRDLLASDPNDIQWLSFGAHNGLTINFDFEFVLQTYSPSGTQYFSQNQDAAMFAFFRNGATDWVIGAEDNGCASATAVGCSQRSDWDYNDALAQISLVSEPGTVVPEPSTYLLMATGLLGLAGFARRRRG